LSAKIESLYVHVPFCAQKCEYCAFYSEAASAELMNRYTAALVREMEIVAGDLKPKTVFFGGGTPSILNLRQWEIILRAMEKLGLLGAEEFTVECNPATVSLDKAKLFRDFGVNRVSMGVQSLDAKLLERLGRVHSREQVFKSFDILRKAGFDNLNVDLMFAIPGQTMEIWRDTLNEAVAMQSEHLSTYEVIYEDDTPLFHQLQAGEFSVDEKLACEMYDEIVSHSARAGFQQYEIANFARNRGNGGNGPLNFRSSVSRPITSSLSRQRGEGLRVRGEDLEGQDEVRVQRKDIPDLACRHNVNYWRGGSFYGLGPAATGFVRGIRAKNWANTQLYCEQLERGKRAIESSEELPPLKRAGETAAFGLRMNAGWPFEEFHRVTDFDLRKEWNSEMDELIGRNWGVRDETRFQLTPQGLRFADSAAELFLR
jgi:oxygen-independent coproporphyrinogen-3 oxidase